MLKMITESESPAETAIATPQVETLRLDTQSFAGEAGLRRRGPSSEEILSRVYKAMKGAGFTHGDMAKDPFELSPEKLRALRSAKTKVA